ncbi:MAG: hypothetical protein PHC44_11065 [Lutispora sp.]|nr:hypothetical protein [Lutispora sp.]MDD4835246.1 hypothetical protein [Lutispora sp.]
MKVFIAGPRAISKLNKNIEERLYNIYSKNITVVVGDANGIDKAVQSYFYKLNYQNVNIYATQGKARCNIGNWIVENVKVESKIKGFDYYAAKDLRMAEVADYGFMIWNGKSKGTLNNIINLLKRNKKTLIYFTPESQFYCFSKLNDFEKILIKCEEEAKILFQSLSNDIVQLSVSEEKSSYCINEQLTF